jgi:hypothetical protein
VNLGPPTNRPKTGTNVPKTGTWRTVEDDPRFEQNDDDPPKKRTKDYKPPPLPVPIVDYTFFDESEFPS